MAQKIWHQISASLLIAGLLFVTSSLAAPAYHRKNYQNYSNGEGSAKRAERRLFPPSSPIHFINPFISMPPSLNNFGNFLAPPPPPMDASSSPIFRLPLRIFSNGKPYGVYSGLPKHHNVMDYLPQAVSNVIRLPLKYMSNAKPVGVYFKNPNFNFL